MSSMGILHVQPLKGLDCQLYQGFHILLRTCVLFLKDSLSYQILLNLLVRGNLRLLVASRAEFVAANHASSFTGEGKGNCAT